MRIALAAALLATLPATAERPTDPDAPPAIQASLERMRSAVARTGTVTYVMHRQEWQDGQAYPAQRVEVKLRDPDELYMHWVGDAYSGRELIYRPGWNAGRLRVSDGALVPTLDLDPRGALAMRGSRHPVWGASLLRTARSILHGADTLSADPQLNASYTDLGRVVVEGQPSHCYQAELPKAQDPGQYADRVVVCMAIGHGLPTRFAAWELHDGALRPIEDYRFEAVVPDAAIGDADFDPDNPAYGF